ncbi:unnamed protein product [Onchocerca ochengi]|uniref:Non-specific serine/threonine protein kinase n=1 Tax=Onchocerca ochengi TaxID=42157 RepID=A0A182E7I0_ONCOC|nr:unnamed protein product [Onchocerca ochengi]
MERQRVEHVLGTLTDPVKLNRKLLPLMEECGKLSEVNAFGWALLAKLVYACDQEMLRTISSRIQKRLIAAAKQPISVPLLHFIRSFLVRFPWLKSFNEQTLAYICSRAVDFSVENCSEGITRLTSNIYALWAGTKYDYILIKTMKDMLNDVIVEEKNDSEKVLFRFETAVQRYLSQFISVIFNLHTEVMEKCSPGDKIAINEWLDIACESAVIVEIEKKDSIFRWLRTFLLKARSCAHLAVRRISSFISDCCYPSEAYYEAVKEYVQLGPNLSEYGKAYAEALGAMLELRSYLLDVQDVIALQYSVCQEVFQKQNCRPALSLLNSLLAMNNELVPSPIQIAQSIFSCSENWCDEVRVGRALCSSISRPRIQMIIPQEDLLKKLSDTVMSDQQIHFDSFQNSTKLIMPKNSEVQSNSTAVNIGLNDDRIETYENIGIESAESAVRKRVYPSPENTSLKHVRIGSEHGEEIFSSKSGSSQSSKTLEITDEKQISNKIGYTLIEQKKFQDTAVVNAAAVKLNSDAVITELDKDVIDRELTIQQIMADFVPIWR